MSCSNPAHIPVFPSDCKLCHEFVLSVVKSKNIPQKDYEIYLKAGGFRN